MNHSFWLSYSGVGEGLVILLVVVFIADARRKNMRAKRVWLDLWAAFAGKYPERKILREWRMNPQKDAAGRMVFCVMWNGGMATPARTWWIKKTEEVAFEEISEEEAGKLIKMEAYR